MGISKKIIYFSCFVIKKCLLANFKFFKKTFLLYHEMRIILYFTCKNMKLLKIKQTKRKSKFDK